MVDIIAIIMITNMDIIQTIIKVVYTPNYSSDKRYNISRKGTIQKIK